MNTSSIGPCAKQITSQITNISSAVIENEFDGPGIFAGELGKALFLYSTYLSGVNSSDAILEHVFAAINSSVSKLENSAPFDSLSLANGLPGLVIVLNELKKDGLLDTEANSILEEVETYLVERITTDSASIYKHGGFDYFYGLTGIGVAFDSFSTSPNAGKIVDAVCKSLSENSEAGEVGITWRDNFSFGVQPFNLGTAHGVLAIMALLSKAVTKYNLIQYRPILVDSVNWYLAQENKSSSYSRFSCSIGINGEDKNTMNRLAWCYGDLPAAIVLLHCYNATGKTSYLSKSKAIIDSTVERRDILFEVDNSDGKIFDGGLCHGLSAIAMSYRVVSDYFNDKSYLNCYEFWLDKLINRTITNDSKTHCFKIKRVPDGNHTYTESFSLLEGACGVGLFLNSLLSPRCAQILSALFLLDIRK